MMYINDLKSKLIRHFENGRELSQLGYLEGRESWFAVDYLARAREFEAGVEIMDDLVQRDSFTSVKSLKLCRHAMQQYRNLLENNGCPLSAHRVAKFIAEMDEVWNKALQVIEPAKGSKNRTGPRCGPRKAREGESGEAE
jgi:hypothetical protein